MASGPSAFCSWTSLRPASWSSRSRGQGFVSRRELGSGFSGRSPSNTSETSPAITNKVDTMLDFRGWGREKGATPNIWNKKNKFVIYKCTIKVCVNGSWRCPGASAPGAEHLTVSLYLCSSGSTAWGESRAPEELPVSPKKPLKGPRRRRGSC